METAQKKSSLNYWPARNEERENDRDRERERAAATVRPAYLSSMQNAA